MGAPDENPPASHHLLLPAQLPHHLRQHVHPGSIPKEPRHQHPHHPLLDPPPLVLYTGLSIAKKLKSNGRIFLLFVYYTYNFVYLSLVIALIVVSFGGNLQKFIQMVRDLLLEPAVWFGTMAQVFLCNVVISDLLYMTVF